MLPDSAHALLAAAFATPPAAARPTSGGFSHRSAFVTLDGAPCVVKAEDDPAKRADLRREAAILGLLAGESLRTARLLALLEDDEWTVLALGALPGESGMVLFERPPAEIAGAYRALGALLANVHRAAPPGAESLPLAARFDAARAALDTLPLAPELRAALGDALAHPAWEREPHGLVHGDPGLHNLLWDGQISALLDWEWAGWGTTALDLAWTRWTIAWRRLPDACWHAFIAGYGAPPPAPATLRALALGQIAAILASARRQPPAFAEWERRLRWTLERAGD